MTDIVATIGLCLMSLAIAAYLGLQEVRSHQRQPVVAAAAPRHDRSRKIMPLPHAARYTASPLRSSAPPHARP